MYIWVMSVMKSFGASIVFNQIGIHGKYNSDDFWEPVEVDILKYSTTPEFLSGALVGGATKTAIIMSLSRDTVIIKNPYMKTDVLDMISFIQMIGKSVVINKNELIISGKLHTNCNFAYRVTLTECVSEIITYSSLAILQHTKLTFRNLNKSIIVRGLKPEFELFDKMGIEYKWEQSDLIIEPTFNISPQIIDVLPQTIQSDHQPFFALLLSYGKGVSTITDHVWEDRYHYISNLNMMNYNDVFKLKAGEQIIFLMNEGTTRKHCSKYNYIVPETQFNASNCERVLRRSIISTFNHGDVPIGLYLSGGIDSGIIASIIKDKLRNEGSALHIEYPGNSEKMLEERTLLPVISELGIRCKRIVFDDTILDNIERIAFSLDEPFYSTVSASTYALSKKAKESVKGVLTGDGSDELIYGYKYLREALQQRDPYQAYQFIYSC